VGLSKLESRLAEPPVEPASALFNWCSFALASISTFGQTDMVVTADRVVAIGAT
jgi:hypothetical protein